MEKDDIGPVSPLKTIPEKVLAFRGILRTLIRLFSAELNSLNAKVRQTDHL